MRFAPRRRALGAASPAPPSRSAGRRASAPRSASILTIAGTEGRATDGAVLLFAYSLGLALPFLAAGIWLSTALAATRPLRAHWEHGHPRRPAPCWSFVGVLLATGQLARDQRPARQLGCHAVKVVSVVGNRPQFIKAAPLVPALDPVCEHVLVHTGQHYDAELSDVFFAELELRAARPRIAARVRAATPSRPRG